MGYNAKNYTEQGGDVTHIGGKLIIEEGAEVEGLPGGSGSYTLPVASADTLGGVKAGAKGAGDTVEVRADGEGKLYVPTYPSVPVAGNQADSAASDVAGLLADFNALLAKLKAAGLMSADA